MPKDFILYALFGGHFLYQSNCIQFAEVNYLFSFNLLKMNKHFGQIY